jgi:hypothetical protein
MKKPGKHDMVMHQLKGPQPGALHSCRNKIYLRRSMTPYQASVANELYNNFGWDERWMLETKQPSGKDFVNHLKD